MSSGCGRGGLARLIRSGLQWQDEEGRPRLELFICRTGTDDEKAPNSRLQAPEKLQAPNFKWNEISTSATTSYSGSHSPGRIGNSCTGTTDIQYTGGVSGGRGGGWVS